MKTFEIVVTSRYVLCNGNRNFQHLAGFTIEHLRQDMHLVHHYC